MPEINGNSRQLHMGVHAGSTIVKSNSAIMQQVVRREGVNQAIKEDGKEKRLYNLLIKYAETVPRSDKEHTILDFGNYKLLQKNVSDGVVNDEFVKIMMSSLPKAELSRIASEIGENEKRVEKDLKDIRKKTQMGIIAARRMGSFTHQMTAGAGVTNAKQLRRNLGKNDGKGVFGRFLAKIQGKNPVPKAQYNAIKQDLRAALTSMSSIDLVLLLGELGIDENMVGRDKGGLDIKLAVNEITNRVSIFLAFWTNKLKNLPFGITKDQIQNYIKILQLTRYREIVGTGGLSKAELNKYRKLIGSEADMKKREKLFDEFNAGEKLRKKGDKVLSKSMQKSLKERISAGAKKRLSDPQTIEEMKRVLQANGVVITDKMSPEEIEKKYEEFLYQSSTASIISANGTRKKDLKKLKNLAVDANGKPLGLSEEDQGGELASVIQKIFGRGAALERVAYGRQGFGISGTDKPADKRFLTETNDGNEDIDGRSLREFYSNKSGKIIPVTLADRGIFATIASDQFNEMKKFWISTNSILGSGFGDVSVGIEEVRTTMAKAGSNILDSVLSVFTGEFAVEEAMKIAIKSMGIEPNTKSEFIPYKGSGKRKRYAIEKTPLFATGGFGKGLSDRSQFISGDSLNNSPNPEKVSIDWKRKTYSVKPIPQASLVSRSIPMHATGGSGGSGTQTKTMTTSDRTAPMAVSLSSGLVTYSKTLSDVRDDGTNVALKVYSVNPGITDKVAIGDANISLMELLYQISGILSGISSDVVTGNQISSGIMNGISGLAKSQSGRGETFTGSGFTSELDGILQGV